MTSGIRALLHGAKKDAEALAAHAVKWTKRAIHSRLPHHHHKASQAHEDARNAYADLADYERDHGTPKYWAAAREKATEHGYQASRHHHAAGARMA